MMKYLTILLLLATILSCSKSSGSGSTTPTGPAQDKPNEQKIIYLTIDGNNRSFILYLPTGYNNAGKMPLIFAIHRGGGTAEEMIQTADFRAIAERDKVVLVYPAGIQNSWNDGRPTPANQSGINDVNFFSQLCNYLVTNNSVDSTKIYATGISNGGFMASRLGCELSNKIAAIAVDAATIEQTTVYAACNPGKPVPAIYIHGTTDPVVPFYGGYVSGSSGGGMVVSHDLAVAKWVSIDGCDTKAVVTNLADIANDGTTIAESQYKNGTNGSEVDGYIVTNGGHTWPQGYQYLPENIIGKTSYDMNACDVTWAFFKRFHR
jgi:polyhydroxybutyrate depolymerase